MKFQDQSKFGGLQACTGVAHNRYDAHQSHRLLFADERPLDPTLRLCCLTADFAKFTEELSRGKPLGERVRKGHKFVSKRRYATLRSGEAPADLGGKVPIKRQTAGLKHPLRILHIFHIVQVKNSRSLNFLLYSP
jgi:hypothetical protein